MMVTILCSYLLGHQFLFLEIYKKQKISRIASQFSSIQLLSCVLLFATPWTAARQTSLCITNSWSLMKLTSIVSVIPSNHLILRHALLLLPSIFPIIKVLYNESILHIRWPKYWSFSFTISPSNEYSGLISLRIDWFDLLAGQGTLKSSPTSLFKSINSLKFSFLYSPTLTSIHDYWKNHSSDQMDFCLQSNVSAFNSQVGHSFLLRSKLLSISRL